MGARDRNGCDPTVGHTSTCLAKATAEAREEGRLEAETAVYAELRAGVNQQTLTISTEWLDWRLPRWRALQPPAEAQGEHDPYAGFDRTCEKCGETWRGVHECPQPTRAEPCWSCGGKPGGGYCTVCKKPTRAGVKWVRTTVGLLESDDGDEALGVGDCLDNYGYELFAPVTIMPTETADTLLEYVRWLAQGWTPTPEERTRLLATIDKETGT